MAGCGMTTSEIRWTAARDSAAMATEVATAVVRLAAIEVAVEVTTASMPPMSLVMRDWTSPVRVLVKKAMDCRCRWANTRVRSSCMTCWPTFVLIQVWITPRAEVTAATASMPMTSQASRCTFFSGSALSMIARSRNGEARLTMDEAAMMAVTTASGQRKGMNSSATMQAASDTSQGLRLLGGGDGARATGAARRAGLPVLGGGCQVGPRFCRVRPASGAGLGSRYY